MLWADRKSNKHPGLDNCRKSPKRERLVGVWQRRVRIIINDNIQRCLPSAFLCRSCYHNTFSVLEINHHSFHIVTKHLCFFAFHNSLFVFYSCAGNNCDVRCSLKSLSPYLILHLNRYIITIITGLWVSSCGNVSMCFFHILFPCFKFLPWSVKDGEMTFFTTFTLVLHLHITCQVSFFQIVPLGVGQKL